jgi:hypothetical protein
MTFHFIAVHYFASFFLVASVIIYTIESKVQPFAK